MGRPTRAELLDELLDRPPTVALQGDHLADPVENDQLDLWMQVGGVLEGLCHPNTGLPLAIGIYADWGGGKTTAMRWLQAALERRGRRPDDPIVQVHTVWFNPWKYATRDEVSRGLLSEVMRSTIGLLPTLDKAASWAEAVGAGAAAALENVTVSLGLVSVTGSLLGTALAAGSQAAAPAHATYLNDFEEDLRTWVERVVPANERLVVFIDDLDRCGPDVALQVLEALKLYLDIPRLAFVVGVDHEVLTEQVVERYRQLGVNQTKAQSYLEKMFQAEVRLTVVDGHLDSILNRQLHVNHLFAALEDGHKELFYDVIRTIAGRTPRQITRLLNELTLFVAGTWNESTWAGVTPLQTEQAFQLFLLRRYLERTDHPDLVDTWEGQAQLGRGDLPPDLQGDETLDKLLTIPFPTQWLAERGTGRPDERVLERIAAQLHVHLHDLPAVLDQVTELTGNLAFVQAISDIPLERLPNLERLNLAASGISHVRGLDKATRLRWLDISWTEPVSLEGLRRLPALKTLVAHGVEGLPELDGVEVID